MANRPDKMIAAALAGAFAMGTALAQDAGGKQPPDQLNQKFLSLDGNQDGMISRMEAHGDEDMERQFQALDQDADGDVDPGEFSAFEVVPPKPARQPGDLD